MFSNKLHGDPINTCDKDLGTVFKSLPKWILVVTKLLICRWCDHGKYRMDTCKQKCDNRKNHLRRSHFPCFRFSIVIIKNTTEFGTSENVYCAFSDVGPCEFSVVSRGYATPSHGLFHKTVLRPKEMYYVYSFCNVHRMVFGGGCASNNKGRISVTYFGMISYYNLRKFEGG